MSTLDDLRSTLEQHADGLDDTERYVRPVAVRGRIRAVRRRRAGVIAVAAALVVLAGVATVDALRTPDTIQPADRVVAGVDVPGSITVADFPYALRELHDLTGDPDDPDNKVHVDKADDDQAALLAASGLGSGSATLYYNGDAVARVRGDEQVTSPVPLGDLDADLRVELDGAGPNARAGVAVYEATGELAPGVSNGSAVFRDQVAGSSLIAAGFSDPGASSVDFQARGSLDRMTFVFYCTAEDDDLMINVDVDGQGAVASSCGGSGRDAGAGSSGGAGGPGGIRGHDVHVYLTRGSGDAEVEAPDGVVFGAGAYERSSGLPVAGVGVDAPRRVEYDGQAWELDHLSTLPATVDTTDGDVVIGFVGRGDTITMSWRGDLDSQRSSTFGIPDGAGIPTVGKLLAGDSYQVAITGGRGQLVVYRPL